MKTKPYEPEEAERQRIEEPVVAYNMSETLSIVAKNREKLRESIVISNKQKKAGLGVDQEDFRRQPQKWRKEE